MNYIDQIVSVQYFMDFDLSTDELKVTSKDIKVRDTEVANSNWVICIFQKIVFPYIWNNYGTLNTDLISTPNNSCWRICLR